MSTPIQELSFTEDWFSWHIPQWVELMTMLPAHERFLELGSFEGRSACWLLDHGLSPTGELVCIDTWTGGPELRGLPSEHVVGSYGRFCQNIAAVKGEDQRVRVITGPTHHGLAQLMETDREAYDLVYVDAGHFAYQTLTDMVMAWPLLKTAGLMIVDDYTWSLDSPLHLRPKMAVDTWLACFHEQYTMVAMGLQVVVRKRG